MKVIIQNAATGRYLASDGQWVADREDARDFHTLLHGYHYAKDHLAGRFQVLLYCPDDQYCASIISGEGISPSNAVPASVMTQMKQSVTFRWRTRVPKGPFLLDTGMDASRFHWN